MNIFYLDQDPMTAAQMHCDKHVVKMIVESAQLLSTAHRVNDGTPELYLNASGRRATRYVIADKRDHILYKATHVNHPSAIWCRSSRENYEWLYSLYVCLLEEYKHRYHRDHMTTKLVEALKDSPSNISTKPFVQPPQAMPDYCKVTGDSVSAYRKYYIEEKMRFAKWTRREVPAWLASNK